MEKRQRFTAEFKREAVRLARESGKQVSVAARELGVPRNRLYKWIADEEKLGVSAFGGSGRKPGDELSRKTGSEPLKLEPAAAAADAVV